MKSFFKLIKKMAQLEWKSLLCVGPLAHDQQLSNFETGGEKDRWMMAFASLRSYSYFSWLLMVVVLYFAIGDFLSLPLSQFVQSIDGQEHEWIFWFGDRGLVGLLFALSISLPIALISRLLFCRYSLLSIVISIFLMFFALLSLRAGLSSLVFSFALFLGLFAVYIFSRSRSLVQMKTMRWRSAVSLAYILVFIFFSFAWYSYLPWILSLIQSYFQSGEDFATGSASLLLSHGRVVQWIVSALAFLVLETFAQMVFFHFYYQYHSRQR